MGWDGGGAWDVHVEALVPVGVQRLLDDARGARLLAIDGSNGEGVGKSCWTSMSDATLDVSWSGSIRTKHIALVEAIGGNDCVVSVSG